MGRNGDLGGVYRGGKKRKGEERKGERRKGEEGSKERVLVRLTTCAERGFWAKISTGVVFSPRSVQLATCSFRTG